MAAASTPDVRVGKHPQNSELWIRRFERLGRNTYFPESPNDISELNYERL